MIYGLDVFKEVRELVHRGAKDGNATAVLLIVVVSGYYGWVWIHDSWDGVCQKKGRSTGSAGQCQEGAVKYVRVCVVSKLGCLLSTSVTMLLHPPQGSQATRHYIPCGRTSYFHRLLRKALEWKEKESGGEGEEREKEREREDV